MRARTNLPVREKRRVELTELRGMDFASSRHVASPRRATSGVNWEPVEGINRKRRGWEQVMRAFPDRINGIFPFSGEEGEELIVYAGTKFYRVTKSTMRVEEIPVRVNASSLFWEAIDRRCQAFLSGGYLYFVGCGLLLRYGSFGGVYEVREIEPYVPVTTVGIGCEERADSAREARDPANLLTRDRKNTLFGESGSAHWILDGSIASGSAVTVDAEVWQGGEVVRVRYTNSDPEDKTKLYNEKGTLSGSISYSEGSVALLDPTVPPADAPNITVTFRAAENLHGAVGIGGVNKIYGCTFGTLFGVGGAQDRLFLSGNPEEPNVIFFSERQDFSYFPDQFTATLGTDGGRIAGLLPLSDSTMAIFCDHGADAGEICYMRGEYRSFYTEEGDLKKTLPVFSIGTSGAGETPITPFAAVNLAGEAMLLSRHGVYGIEYLENIVSDARVTRRRGTKIAPKICKERLEEAVMIAHGERLYIALGDHCFVTERAFRYREADTDGMEYEWWYWEHFPARVLAVVGDVLWFGTEDGRLCRMWDACVDHAFLETQEGEITFAYGTGQVVPSAALAEQMGYGRPLCFLTPGVMAEVMVGCDRILDGRIYVPDGVMDLIRDGLPVYAARFGGASMKEGRVYYICDADRAAGCFSISNTPGGVKRSLDGADTDLRLYTEISGQTVYVGMMDLIGTNRYVRLTPDGSDIKIANYFRPREEDSEVFLIPVNPICRILDDFPVRVYWETPILELGSSLYPKDLLMLTLSAARLRGERIVLGYETEKGRREFLATLPDALSLDDADLSFVSLERGDRENILKSAAEKGFQSIRFFFSSDTRAPTAVYGVGAIYRMQNKMKKGAL